VTDVKRIGVVLCCLLLAFATVGLTVGLTAAPAEASWLTTFMANTSWWFLFWLLDAGSDLDGMF
jgi:hypothetical protein